MEGRRSNEVSTYYVACRIRGLRRDVKVEATWENAEKAARQLMVDEARARGFSLNGGEVEFLGIY